MLLLLDGYNILKKMRQSSYITDSERQKFIKQLNNYAHQKKLSLILVFDGGPYSWPMHEKISTWLEVVYSGSNESADDYIKNYMDNHKNVDILLVSSDRELVTHARHNSNLSLDSHDFSQLLHSMESPSQDTQSSKKQAHKLTTTKNKELDMLMEQLNLNKNKKEPEEVSSKNKTQTLSKQERKLLQKIKKL